MIFLSKFLASAGMDLEGLLIAPIREHNITIIVLSQEILETIYITIQILCISNIKYCKNYAFLQSFTHLEQYYCNTIYSRDNLWYSISYLYGKQEWTYRSDVHLELVTADKLQVSGKRCSIGQMHLPLYF